VPGLGTGVGGMDPAVAAEQMRTAHDSVFGERWKGVVHPAQASYAMPGFRFRRRKGGSLP
jgi:hypothetical protein